MSGAGRRWRHLRLPAFVPAAVAAAWLLSACAPEYNCRDIRGPGGDYWVQLPAKPAVMSRRIHLEGYEVDMTMQGAKVRQNAFTVAQVPLPGHGKPAIPPQNGGRGAHSPRLLTATPARAAKHAFG